MNIKDLTGKNFGLWTAIKRSEKKNYNGYFWLCLCKCGTERLVHIRALNLGISKSCGCARSSIERRYKFFDSLYEINSNGCWEWQGYRNKEGYARLDQDLGHRFSYERFKGQIPANMCVCHNCPGGDNRGCVNPDHLWLGTLAENIRDKGPKGRQNRGSNQSCSKLKEHEVSSIKQRLKNDECIAHIAKEYNVSAGLISHIKQGRAWKHID